MFFRNNLFADAPSTDEDRPLTSLEHVWEIDPSAHFNTSCIDLQ